MNHPKVPVLLAAALLGACAHTTQPHATTDLATAPAVEPSRSEALLLVSLDDGTVIMQTIESAASVCFKLNSEASTTCLSQGAPLIDPTTETVIGYEMIEQKIELYAKSD